MFYYRISELGSGFSSKVLQAVARTKLFSQREPAHLRRSSSSSASATADTPRTRSPALPSAPPFPPLSRSGRSPGKQKTRFFAAAWSRQSQTSKSDGLKKKKRERRRSSGRKLIHLGGAKSTREERGSLTSGYLEEDAVHAEHAGDPRGDAHRRGDGRRATGMLNAAHKSMK